MCKEISLDSCGNWEKNPKQQVTGSGSYLVTDNKIMDFRLITECYIPEEFFKFCNFRLLIGAETESGDFSESGSVRWILVKRISNIYI